MQVCLQSPQTKHILCLNAFAIRFHKSHAGGDVRELDFRWNVGNAKIGAPFHGLRAFFTTQQLSTLDKVAAPLLCFILYDAAKKLLGCHQSRSHCISQAANSLALGTSPVVRALVDAEGGMRDVRALDGISFADWFRSHGGSQGSIDRMWDPIGADWMPSDLLFLFERHHLYYSPILPCSVCTWIFGLRGHQCALHAHHIPIFRHKDGRIGAAHAQRLARRAPAEAHHPVHHQQGWPHTPPRRMQVGSHLWIFFYVNGF